MAVNTSNPLAPNPLQVTIYPLPGATGSGSTSNSNAVSSGQSSSGGQFWSGDAPTFKDFLDTINPLQHLPVISTLYQSLTGDVPSSGANIVGGTLMGGALGFASALFNEIVKTQSGKDVGGNLLAMINGETSTSSTQIADNTPADTNAPSPTNRAAYNAYTHAQSMFA